MAKYSTSMVRELKPMILMVISQVAFGAVNIFYKLAFADGMRVRILIPYRLWFATAVMVPLALVLERNGRPKLTWMIAFQGFLCGLFGASLGHNLSGESLFLTSATFIAAMSNLIPALTFIMAILFRVESLAIRTLAGKAKVLGTVLGIAGAMVLTFYKGLEINIWPFHVHLLHHDQARAASEHNSGDHVWGSLLAVISCVSYAAWLIIQTKMSQRYPCYSSTALMCLMGALQATVYALCTEKDWSAWKLGWNIRLVTIVYTGLVPSGLMIQQRGAHGSEDHYMFLLSTPTGLIFVAIIASLFLDEKLYLGSIIGAVLIIAGLLIVLSGKGKEMKMAQSLDTKITRDGLTEISLVSDGNQAVIIPITLSAQPSDASSAALDEA
ncbi:LOW QUALITY PROTEIN: hypothetical protein RJ640_009989 [Escallonia rubra]|uniref:WAT1-related protein n=1 Tax=Escallonia rubra TaxID=112253 RepID=A0AA88R0P6_9ASTE|nr:LOW QUALITY PROTEIN: hypothetical protein RJ640_009989 [Escallonia rubra]